MREVDDKFTLSLLTGGGLYNCIPYEILKNKGQLDAAPIFYMLNSLNKSSGALNM